MVVTVDHITDRLIRNPANLGETGFGGRGVQRICRDDTFVSNDKDVAVKAVPEVIDVRR
jgi:hypothetical protein